MTEIANLGQLVARILRRLADGSYGEGFHEPFERGSAVGEVRVLLDPDNPGTYEFQVQMSIMRAPSGGDPELLRRLLELNHDLRGRASFALDANGEVSLLVARPVPDLDPSEVVDMILWTSEQADRLDDVLHHEFGYGPAR